MFILICFSSFHDNSGCSISSGAHMRPLSIDDSNFEHDQPLSPACANCANCAARNGPHNQQSNNHNNNNESQRMMMRRQHDQHSCGNNNSDNMRNQVRLVSRNDKFRGQQRNFWPLYNAKIRPTPSFCVTAGQNDSICSFFMDYFSVSIHSFWRRKSKC